MRPLDANDRNWHIHDQPVGLVHVCKCTCYSTNSTLIPLYMAQHTADPCSLCTKQFCVDHVEACHGAKIVDGSGDTATGFEGQVWAKCFGMFSFH